MAKKGGITRASGAASGGFTVNPEEIGLNEAVQLLVEDPLYTEARAFYDGDHWQGGEAWVGPRLDENDQESTQVMDEIEESLVSHPAIEEVTDRHKDAVTVEPGWSLVPRRDMREDEEPSDGEKRLIDEANAELTAWWDDKDAIGELQEAVVDLQLGGRGLLRLMVPEGELVVGASGDPEVPRGVLSQSLERIWPVQVPATQGEVLRDPITMKQVGVYVYEVRDVITGELVQLAEISYLDDQGNTVVRVTGLGKTGGGSSPVDFGRMSMNLGGRLTLFKMQGKRLITEPVVSNQKLLNMDLTMMGKNVVLGGFLERVILNGQPPGEWAEDPSTGKKEFVPGKYKVGAATTNWVSGVVVGYDENTRAPIIANPSVVYRDPVPTDTFTKTQEAAYRNVLHGARQLHVVMSGDAVASGESRKQARDDYEKSLKKTKNRVDAAGKWLLESALWMASTFSGQAGRFKSLRVDFDAQVDAGPISAEDRNSMMNEVTGNLRSRENYMIVARVTKDPVAEKKKIMDEMDTLNPVAAIQQERQRLGLAADRQALGLPPDPGGPLGRPASGGSVGDGGGATGGAVN